MIDVCINGLYYFASSILEGILNLKENTEMMKTIPHIPRVTWQKLKQGVKTCEENAQCFYFAENIAGK